jgi:hypothetical protein
MPSLEQTHIKTVEEAIEILNTSGYHHTKLESKLNQLIGYLQANDEIKKTMEAQLPGISS